MPKKRNAVDFMIEQNEKHLKEREHKLRLAQKRDRIIGKIIGWSIVIWCSTLIIIAIVQSLNIL